MLTAEEGSEVFTDDSMMPYFSLMGEVEMVAKTGGEPLLGKTLKEKQEETRQRYKDSVDSFSVLQQKTLADLVSATHGPLYESLPMFKGLPWVFLNSGTHIEGGLPHTRDKAIALSDLVMAGLMAETTQAEQTGGIPLRGVMLLIHEQVHVFQRMNPGYFDDLYTSVWGFQKADLPPLVPPLDRVQLLNPDAVICDWVFTAGEGDGKQLYLPLVSFKHDLETPQMPKDMIKYAVPVDLHRGVWYFNQDKHGHTHPLSLDEVPGYAERFVPGASTYHPEEIMADTLAWLVLLDHFLKPGDLPAEMAAQAEAALKPVRAWLAKQESGTGQE